MSLSSCVHSYYILVARSSADSSVRRDVLDAVRSRSEERGQQVALSQDLTAHGALALLARDCLSVRPPSSPSVVAARAH